MRLSAALTAVTATAILATGLAGAAQADTISSEGFEGFNIGDVNQQEGWTKTGPYDVEIVDPTDLGVTDMGSRALRMSNAITSGSFGDQTFSAPLVDEAGETIAANDGLSGGDRQPVFTASFAVRAASAAPQPGLAVSISPDRGDGARMSYLRLEDTAGGIDVYFDDYSSDDRDFRETRVTTLDRRDKHTIGLTMVFVDGPANDIVNVSVDGTVLHSGTSWEDYFTDWENSSPPRTVDSLLFRSAGSASSTTGRGFLFDDVVLSSEQTAPCQFLSSDDTMTLLSDCTTDHTIRVPDGYTLDGNGHTITAVDPAGGHFVGGVVANAGSHASVVNLTVTAQGLASSCDVASDRLAGIRLDGASGAIRDNTITGIQQGTSGDGCQEGNAIEVRNAEGAQATSVTVDGNTVSDYQKTGIVVSGPISAEVTDNDVSGYGPVGFIAQNGVQVSYGATGLVDDNTISDNYYAPKSWQACGLLIAETDGVRIGKGNVFLDNEKNLCNYSRGGTYKVD
jgi:hypothetical protein